MTLRRPVASAPLLAILGIILLAVAAVVVSVLTSVPPGPGPGEIDSRTRLEDPGDTGESITPEAPHGSGGIAGTVRRRGVPCIARIEVRPAGDDLDLPAGEPIALATAGEDGRYRTGPLARGSVELRAIAQDGASVRRTIDVPADGAPLAADLDLPGGPHPLRGRLRWADGRPFVGFAIVEGLVSPTDDEGRFAFAGLEAGRWKMGILAPGRARFEGREVEIPSEEDLEIVVDEGWREVRGRVLVGASEETVPGAIVEAHSRNPVERQILQADEKGVFSVRLARRQVTIFARHDDLRSTGTQLSAKAAEIDLRLLAPGRFVGRVLAADDDQPLAGIAVVAGGVRTVSGTDGRYALENLPLGEMDVRALGPTHLSPEIAHAGDEGSARPLAVTVRPGKTTERDLRVVRCFRAQGRVTGPDGPLAAVVTASGAFGSWGSGVAELPAMVSAADGTFLLEGLLPGEGYRLKASAPGLVPAESRVLVGRPGETVEADLRLEAGLWIAVTVLAPDAVAVPGATVRCGDLSAVTGPAGTARLGPIPAGLARVHAHRHDLGIAHVMLSPMDRPATLLLRLEPCPIREEDTEGAGDEPEEQDRGPVVLRIECAGPDGSPVPRADVEVTGTGSPWFRSWRAGTIVSGVVEFRGRNAVEAVRIEVRGARDAAGQPLPFGPAAVGPVPFGVGRVEVRLPPARVIAGVVLDPDDRPGVGIMVSASPILDDGSTGPGESARTDGRGRFRIERLGPGAHQLTATDTSAWREPEPVTTTAGNEEIVLRLRPGLDVVFTIVGPDGKAVPGVKVELLPPDESTGSMFIMPSWKRTAVTDAEGRVRFAGLDPDQDYRVWVIPTCDYDPALSTWSPGGDPTIRLQRLLHIEGIILDGAGNPVPDLSIARIDSKGVSRSGGRTTCRDGTFRIGPLRPGGYVLVPYRPGDDWGDERWPRRKVEAGSSGVTLVYDPGWELVARISNWPAGVQGDAWLADGRRATVTIDGLVRFGGLAHGGRYALWVKPPDHDGYAIRKDIGEDTRDLTLDLQRGRTIRVRVRLGEDTRKVKVSFPFGPTRLERTLTEDATFEIRGVPPEILEASVDVSKRDGWTLGSTETIEDDRVEIDTRR